MTFNGDIKFIAKELFSGKAITRILFVTTIMVDDLYTQNKYFSNDHFSSNDSKSLHETI